MTSLPSFMHLRARFWNDGYVTNGECRGGDETTHRPRQHLQLLRTTESTRIHSSSLQGLAFGRPIETDQCMRKLPSSCKGTPRTASHGDVCRLRSKVRQQVTSSGTTTGSRGKKLKNAFLISQMFRYEYSYFDSR